MSGIYGDMLIAFPEQLRKVNVFKMEAKVNGGWTVDGKSQFSVRGIFHHTTGKQIKENGGNLAVSSGYELWTNAENLTGLFTRIQTDTYRIKGVSAWAYEGGFLKYSLEKVIGNDGIKSKNTAWNTGSHSFS